jgi:hypothetical protein
MQKMILVGIFEGGEDIIGFADWVSAGKRDEGR